MNDIEKCLKEEVNKGLFEFRVSHLLAYIRCSSCII